MLGEWIYGPIKKIRRVGFEKRVKKSVQEKIFCDCRMPNDKDLSMVKCNVCSQWYHHKCLAESTPKANGFATSAPLLK